MGKCLLSDGNTCKKFLEFQDNSVEKNHGWILGTVPIAIGSMGLVYSPTLTINVN